MIKTIILDESKVNAFLTALRMEKGIALVANESLKAKSLGQVDEILTEFLEATKIEPQTNKPNQSLPYEVNH